MAKIQKEIADAFLKGLEGSTHVTAEMTQQLRALLAGGKKVKADDLVEIFSPPPGGEID